MTHNPETSPDNTQQEGAPEETIAERSARLEEQAAKLAEQGSEPDHLSPEPAELYSAQDLLDTSDLSDADGHLVITRLQTELDEAKDKMMRAVAEAENTRRRAQKEREDARKFATAGFARELLSVADNLRRALDAVPEDFADNDQLKGLFGGIEATERELLNVFERNGIQKFNPEIGKDIFDPNHHEVMFEAPGTGQPAGTIIQIMEPGYMLHERLIRPARVGVAKDDGGAASDATHVDTQA